MVEGRDSWGGGGEIIRGWVREGYRGVRLSYLHKANTYLAKHSQLTV